MLTESGMLEFRILRESADPVQKWERNPECGKQGKTQAERSDTGGAVLTRISHKLAAVTQTYE